MGYADVISREKLTHFLAYIGMPVCGLIFLDDIFKGLFQAFQVIGLVTLRTAHRINLLSECYITGTGWNSIEAGLKGG